MRNNQLKLLTTISMLVAVEVVLSRFLSITAWNTKIGFSFVPVAIAGMMYGPLVGGIVATISDLIGATLFPSGPFFPGFTFSACVTGIIFGLCLHKKQDASQIATAVLANQLICSLILNTTWVVILYHSSYAVLLPTRLFQSAVLIPVQFLTILAISKVSYFTTKGKKA